MFIFGTVNELHYGIFSMEKAKNCLISNYIIFYTYQVLINIKSVYTIHNTDARGVLEVLKLRRGSILLAIIPVLFREYKTILFLNHHLEVLNQTEIKFYKYVLYYFCKDIQYLYQQIF